MILRIDNLTKEYGKNNSYQKVLDDINIEFKSGEFVCILGESGSGKSSLLNILGGLDSNYKGNVNINNMNLKYIDLDEYRENNIGFIFQNFNLIPSMSIIDNIILPIEKKNISYNEKKNKAIELLRRLNIYNIKNKRVDELSGGQKQRVAIARALIKDPLIILADEPTGSLDESNSDNILSILKEINKEGKLVIVVTHSNKVIEYSSRVVVIKDGKIFSDKKNKRIKETKIEKYNTPNNKFLYLLKYGLRNILNNKKRNIFIMFASSIGIIGIILSLFIGEGIKRYMEDLIVDKVNPLVYSVTMSNDDIYSVSKIDNNSIDKIKKIDHIKKINKNISYNVSSINYDDEDYNLSYLDSFSDKIDLEEGNDNGLIINKYLYDKLDNPLNKKIKLTFMDNYEVFTINTFISGVSKDSGLSLLDNSVHAYISYDILEDEYEKEDIELEPTDLSIEIDNKNNIDYVKEKLKELDFNCSNNIELYDELNSYLSIATFILSFLSSLSLIVSIIMISIITNITVLERTKEIGLLRSIGFTKKDIKYIFNCEALILGFVIGLFSIYISKILIKGIKNIIKDNFDININSSMGRYYFFCLLLSIIVLLISTYLPSKKASNQDPISSLRYE